MVADGQYHIAELIAVKKNFTLRVDRGLARSIINEGSKDYLKLTTPMYLGGIPPEPGQQAFTQWHLRNLTSFNGKIHLLFLMMEYVLHAHNFLFLQVVCEKYGSITNKWISRMQLRRRKWLMDVLSSTLNLTTLTRMKRRMTIPWWNRIHQIPVRIIIVNRVASVYRHGQVIICADAGLGTRASTASKVS